MESPKMIPLTIVLLLLSTFPNPSSAATAAAAVTRRYKTYLKTACADATYPKLCYTSLAPYTSAIKTDDVKLCSAALAVTLQAVKDTSSLVSRLRKLREGLGKGDVAVLKDCDEVIKDAVDELKQTAKVVSRLMRKGAAAAAELDIANMRTWLSAAITDETTCADVFDGQKVSAAVKGPIWKSIKKVERLTSNALALVDKLAY
ncbi:unnamed protein product [Linum trigynum]|uniref:pectinesterase n=1 Tax=Linum trigynum TaxID=586398 RepID=A0AAV2G6F2_9ROSI